MSATSSGLQYSDAKKQFEDIARSNLKTLMKKAIFEILVSEQTIPTELKAAFSIDTAAMLRDAFEEAMKELQL